MYATALRAVESPVYQSPNESILYQITTTPWGSSPSGVTVTVYDDTGTDVSGTVVTGSASVASDVITLPAIASLTEGSNYDVRVAFTISGNTLEARFDLLCR